MKNSYPFKVWISTMLSAPTLLCSFYLIVTDIYKSVSGFCFSLLVATSIGFTCSIPAFALSYSLFNYLRKNKNSSPVVKLKYILTSIAGVIVTFILIICVSAGPKMLKDLSSERTTILMFLAFFIPYALCIVVYGLYFKVEPKEVIKDV